MAAGGSSVGFASSFAMCVALLKNAANPYIDASGLKATEGGRIRGHFR
jgi:hypothetical protein